MQRRRIEEEGEIEESEEDDESAREKDKKAVAKERNITKQKDEKTKVLVKFEIEKRNEEDAITMARIISRAANLKKESAHAVAKFLFEQCLAEYRANKMLE